MSILSLVVLLVTFSKRPVYSEVPCVAEEYCQFEKYPTFCSPLPIAVLYTDGPALFSTRLGEESYLSDHRYLSYLNVFGNGSKGVGSCMIASDLSYSGYVGIKMRGRSTKHIPKSQFSVKPYGNITEAELADAKAHWLYTVENGGDVPANSTCTDLNSNFFPSIDCSQKKTKNDCLPEGAPLPYPCEWIPNTISGKPQDMPKKKATKMMGKKSGKNWIFHAPGTYDLSLIRSFLAYNLARDTDEYASRTELFELFVVAEYGRAESLQSRVPSITITGTMNSGYQQDYRGIYLLAESPKSIGPNHVPITEINSDDGFKVDRGADGGYILSYDDPDPYDIRVSAWMGPQMNIQYPSSDDLTPSQFSYIQNALTEWDNHFKQAIDLVDPSIDNPLNPSKLRWLRYRDYIDMDSWALYILHMDISKNQDGYSNSYYMHKHKNSNVDPCPSVELPSSSNLVINEISSNPSQGEDWVEFYNRDSVEVDITGWYFTDSESKHVFTFPDGTKVGGSSYLTIHVNDFGLGSQDQVNLYNSEGAKVDSHEWFNENVIASGNTLERCPNGDGAFEISDSPSPGAENNCSTHQPTQCITYPASEYFGPPLPKGTFGKWECGPAWDYNLAYANDVAASYVSDPTGWKIQSASAYWRKFLNDPLFVDVLVTHWTLMRRSKWSVENITNLIEETKTLLIGDVNGNSPIQRESQVMATQTLTKFSDEAQKLKDWFQSRLSWIDEHICELYVTNYNPSTAETDSMVPTHPTQKDSPCSSCMMGECVCGLCVCYKGYIGSDCSYTKKSKPLPPSPPSLVSRTARTLTISWNHPNEVGSAISNCEVRVGWVTLGSRFERSAGKFGLETSATVPDLMSNRTYWLSVRCKTAHDIWSNYSAENEFLTAVPSYATAITPTLVQSNKLVSLTVVDAEAGDTLAIIDASCNFEEITLPEEPASKAFSPGIYQFCYRPQQEKYKKMQGVTLRSVSSNIPTQLITSAIANNNDDLEEQGSLINGVWSWTVTSSTSSDLELGVDGVTPQIIGLRFSSLSFPMITDDQIIAISSAFVTFVAKDPSSSSASFVIHGVKDSSAFADVPDVISGRSQTMSSVKWSNVEPWVQDQSYQTVDISPIIQELIDLEGDLTELFNLVLSISSSCSNCFRRAYSKDAGSGEPSLHINYWILDKATSLPSCDVCPSSETPTSAPPVKGQLKINEVMAKNSLTIQDSSGKYEDWVEIYNPGPDPEELGLYYMTDDPVGKPTSFQLPHMTLNAGEYKLIWCDDDTLEGPDHAPFKLSSSGETLALFDSSRRKYDEVQFGTLGEDEAWGRLPDGTGEFTFVLPTPGLTNLNLNSTAHPTSAPTSAPTSPPTSPTTSSPTITPTSTPTTTSTATPTTTSTATPTTTSIATPTTTSTATPTISSTSSPTTSSAASPTTYPTATPTSPFPNGALTINEIMAKNEATKADPVSNKFEDWVELFNAGNSPLQLDQYYFTDEPIDDPLQYKLPNIILQPGEWILIWCVGKDATPGTDHAPFKLGSGGETLAIIDENGKNISVVTYLPLDSDEAYGRYPDGTGSFDLLQPTPGGANQGFSPVTDSPTPPGTPSTPIQIRINELMAKNNGTVKDPIDQKYEDWVELYNAGTQAVNLNLYFLSDDPTLPLFFQLPSMILAPGEFALIWMDNEIDQGTNHAPFKLGADGETLTLTYFNQKIVDNITFPPIQTDMSYGRYPDGNGKLTSNLIPTPNRANQLITTPSPTTFPTSFSSPSSTSPTFSPITKNINPAPTASNSSIMTTPPTTISSAHIATATTFSAMMTWLFFGML